MRICRSFCISVSLSICLSFYPHLFLLNYCAVIKKISNYFLSFRTQPIRTQPIRTNTGTGQRAVRSSILRMWNTLIHPFQTSPVERSKYSLNPTHEELPDPQIQTSSVKRSKCSLNPTNVEHPDPPIPDFTS